VGAVAAAVASAMGRLVNSEVSSLLQKGLSQGSGAGPLQRAVAVRKALLGALGLGRGNPRQGCGATLAMDEEPPAAARTVAGRGCRREESLQAS
jgi:hypothetical protein